MKYLFLSTCILLLLTVAGCNINNSEPNPGPPLPPDPMTFIARDSISEGNYRGININSTANEIFEILEAHRLKEEIVYVSAVNNYFSDITDLKDRIHLFENVTLDEKFDTDSGVQLILQAGKVKSIKLNNRTVLTQWPQTPGFGGAVRIGDQPDALYNKLVAIQSQSKYAHKFQRIVLTTKYTYAMYDPEKALLPWSFIYSNQNGKVRENVQVYFKDKKVHYIIVNRFQKP